MVDSIAAHIQSQGMGAALDSIGPLLRFAEGIEKCRHVLVMLQQGYQLGKELDDALKKKRDELAANTQRIEAEARTVATGIRNKIIEDARAEAKKLMDEARVQVTAINDQVSAAQARLDTINTEIASAKKRFSDAIGA